MVFTYRSSDLTVSSEFSTGDDKDIVFQAIETVHTKFRVFAEGQDNPLRQHQELWHNRELKYKVHYANGATIQPGVYTLRSNSLLTPYQVENVNVSTVENQMLEFTVPFTSARISYAFVQEPRKKGRRCWVTQVDADGKPSSKSSKALLCDGTEILMTEGRYFVKPWKSLGEFEETYFETVKGETTIVTVQQK